MGAVLHFPDISNYDAGIDFRSSYTVIAKATEGTNYTNPEYGTFKVLARQWRVWLTAYHFLHAGNGAAQAQHCFNVVGRGVGLALDCELTGRSQPTIQDMCDFIDKYRQLGGELYLSYLPHWYWQDYLKSPDLSPLKDRRQWLWSSDYVPYDDNGPGWEGYGGLPVAIWQYSDSVNYGNVSQVDFNAFKGTGSNDLMVTFREYQRLVLTGNM